MFLLSATGIICYILFRDVKKIKGFGKVLSFVPMNLGTESYVIRCFVGADEYSFGTCTHTHKHIAGVNV